MAKHRTASTALAPLRPIIIQSGPSRVPARRRAVAVARRVGSGIRTGVRHVARHGKQSLPMLAVGAGGAGVGWLEGAGHLDFVPTIGGSRDITLAIAGFIATRMKNKWVKAAGLATVAAAAFSWGKEQGEKGKAATHGASGPASDGLDGDDTY